MRKAESAKTAYLKRYSRPGFYGRIPKIPTGKFIDELHRIHSCRTGQVGYTRLEYGNPPRCFTMSSFSPTILPP